MIQDLRKIKQSISEDWQKAFPQLVRYSEKKLYKVTGPFVIGIELIDLPRSEGYRPHFVVYSLWKANIKECFSGPVLQYGIKDKKGLSFSIPFENHDRYFSEAVDCTKSQIKLSLISDIVLLDFLKVFDDYSRTPPLSAAPDSYLQAKLAESKLCTALYTNNATETKSILADIEKKAWNLQHFKLFQIDFDQWLMGLHKIILNREIFISQISANKKDKTLQKLNSSELKSE
jgi:hypothetical protein